MSIQGQEMKSIAMETCIVTGGAGFIGNHLCRRLHARGKRVICLDDMATGSARNLADLTTSSRFQMVRGKVEESVALFGDLERIDVIYNLACPASPPQYQSRQIETLDASYLGMRAVLELALAKGARVLQASTSEVYGIPLEHPQRESYFGNVNSYGMRACYDEGKRAAEALCFAYERERGADVRIGRIFNTYGPGMQPDDGRVVSNFVCQALLGEDLTLYGDGRQTRSFCYVDDMVEALLALAASGEEVRGPVNLGNPQELSLLDLASLVLEKTGAKSQLKVMDTVPDDPHCRRPDISRARELLGWAPSTDISDGLDRTIEYFRKLVLSSRKSAVG